MTCSSCVDRIERETRKLPGVRSASIALATSRGVFTYDDSLVGPRQIMKLIEVQLNFR